MTDSHKQLQLADLELPAKRGRPKSGNALSNADKQRDYRNRKKASGAVHMTLGHEELCILSGFLHAVISDEPWRMDLIKKAHGTQLEPLRKKLLSMSETALNNAWKSIDASSTKRLSK